jgi:hypothetical protein
VVLAALAYALAMVLAGAVGYRQRLGVAILTLLSLSWFTMDKLFEGRSLVRISTSMGITASDLVGLAGLLWAAWLGYYKHYLPRVERERADAGR